MNREAAVLGTPAATIFMGRMGAVDRWLIEQKRVIAATIACSTRWKRIDNCNGTARIDILGESESDRESRCRGCTASDKTASIHVNSPLAARR